MDTPPAANTRSRASSPSANGSPPKMSTATRSAPRRRGVGRNPPFLPTRLERAVLAAYPALLVFGALFSLVSPQTRALEDAAQAQNPALSPSYFARKDNLFNVVFVKRGWAWISGAFALFVLTHPAFSSASTSNAKTTTAGLNRGKAVLRWALVTGWWVLVTQWCFGPPLIDRGFRFTGGRCEVVMERIEELGPGGEVTTRDIVTAAACRAARGKWSGGHDISGHVFLLVVGSFFLLQEVGWVVLRRWQRGRAGTATTPVAADLDERTVVMADGAVKGAGVKAGAAPDRGSGDDGDDDVLGLGGRFAAGVVALSFWMLLMTAIYFHTWLEKLTGLLVAMAGLYAVYILPRLIPAVRGFVGLPGI